MSTDKSAVLDSMLSEMMPPDPDVPSNMTDDTLVAEEAKLNVGGVQEQLVKAVDEYIGDELAGVAPDDKSPAIVKPVEVSDAATLRRQEMKARIERIQAANSERKQSQALEARKLELERNHREVESYRESAKQDALEAEKAKNLWKQSLRDPIAAYKELGYAPEEVYQKVTDAVLQRDNPESKEQILRDRLSKELFEQLNPKLSQLDVMKKELEEFKSREQMRFEREQALSRFSTEKEFISLTKEPGYEVLADYYEDTDLIRLGDQIAGEYIAEAKSAGKRPQFTLQDIRTEIKDRLQYQVNRAEERRRQRLASAENGTARPQEKKQLVATEGSKVTSGPTIGNDLASETGSSIKRARTQDERMRLAALQLERLQRSVTD